MDDEQQLIRRVIDRHPEAEDEFVSRYSGLVLGLARGRFGLVGDAAEDVLQSTMEKLWERDLRVLRAWRGRGRFTSYLTVIVTHLVMRRRARERRRREDTVEPDELAGAAETLHPTAPESTPDTQILSQERQRLVDEAWRELSSRDRLLLALRFGDDRSPKEIASLTGQRSGAVRKAVHDAVRRLRQRLAQRRPELFDMPTAEVIRPAFANRGGSS